MAKQTDTARPSSLSGFTDWDNTTLDISEFDYCHKEWRRIHEKKMMTSFGVTLLLFALGLWAVWEGAWVAAVLLIAIADNSNRKSSHHMLVSELMSSQRLLAMLINRQSQELETFRSQISSLGSPLK